MAVTSIKEVFEKMPGRLQGLPADLNAVIQFELGGEGGGQYYLAVANGAGAVTEGTAASPNMTLSAAAVDFLRLVNGELNPMAAFMQGAIRVKGDVSLAMKLQSLFSA